ncbi:hypothetical protein CMUS01_01921 [Colletotrichum musicola]|uniref:Uncharacterized protein n=1 Tax=Colletotrichum musicola TaxID=2175873 RepID=A0A8H6NW97_9PEZI|nr:hypothetical protein CMUS01_01921 [Colletotrichum musicola]
MCYGYAATTDEQPPFGPFRPHVRAMVHHTFRDAASPHTGRQLESPLAPGTGKLGDTACLPIPMASFDLIAMASSRGSPACHTILSTRRQYRVSLAKAPRLEDTPKAVLSTHPPRPARTKATTADKETDNGSCQSWGTWACDLDGYEAASPVPPRIVYGDFSLAPPLVPLPFSAMRARGGHALQAQMAFFKGGWRRDAAL